MAKGKYSEKGYRKDLDSLFSNDGKIPDRFKDLLGEVTPDENSKEGIWRNRIAEIEAISDFREYAKAMKVFVKEKQAFPDKEDFLIRCLDHPTEKVLLACLKHIANLFERRGFERTDPIQNRMATMRSLSEFPETLVLLDQIEIFLNSK